MEKEAIEVATPKSVRAAAKKPQSTGRVKNLEKEMEHILAQVDSDKGGLTTKPEISAKDMQAVTLLKSRRYTIKETTLLQTPKSDAFVQAEHMQTPRRSVRKSIKPIQDYEDIVAKKSIRSLKKSEKQSSVEEETEEEKEKEAPKWTPAKVGRVSQKRKSRKSRKNIGKKPQEDGEQTILVDVDVLEVIANDEDENKENVEPQKLLRNRKSPKDEENKGSTTRRSNETCLSLSGEKAKAKVKHAEAHLQPLIALSLEEVRAREKCSPKASNVEQEFVKQCKTEIEELSELGLNPISLDEPALQSLNSSKQEKEEEEEDTEAVEKEKEEEDTEAVEKEKEEQEQDQEEKEGQEEKAAGTTTTKDEIKAKDKVRLVEDLATSISVAAVSEDKVESLIIEEVVLEGQQENTTTTYFQNQNATNSPFYSSNCGLSATEPENTKNRTTNETAVLDDKYVNYITPNPKETNEANNTFNTSDCIIVSPDVESSKPALDKKEQILAINIVDLNNSMPSLLISDDEDQDDTEEDSEKLESPAAKIPRILINDEEHVSSTPQKTNTAKINIVAPLVATSGTPKMCKTKPYRFPTPYKSRVPQSNHFDFNSKQEEAETNTEDEISDSALPPMVLKLTNLEPKEIVLSCMRKRSLSVCNDRPPKKQLSVKFHSPANQTTDIETFDRLISKSAKKDLRCLRGGQLNSMVLDTSKVTKRRKRSLSVDESLMMARLKAQQAPLTPSKLKNTPQKLLSRTKIPNFAVIHQRQFNKMENLVDHVTRKAERAKVLTTSASKLRGMSAQKGGFSSNNQNIEPTSGVAGGAASSAAAGTTHTRIGRPKALKKIDLTNNTMKPMLPVAAKKLHVDECKANSTAINLPNPQLSKNIVTVQPITSGKKLNKMEPKHISKTVQPIQIQQAKPSFNLSTNIKTQSANSSIFERTATLATLSSSKTTKSLADKVATRRQRHMDMFKGRSGDKASKDKDKSIEIIRGVRSNRRFDLQMQHRKNLNHDNI